MTVYRIAERGYNVFMDRIKVRFGPAGGGPEFYQSGCKKCFETPKWLNNLGLSAYEYQANRGVRINQSDAQRLKQEAESYDIKCSIHAPYFINLVSDDYSKLENSECYILDSMRAAKWIGADKVVFHVGWYGKEISRSDALECVSSALERILEKARQRDLNDILLAPETAGKVTQFGNLSEILKLCGRFPENVVPAVDFGHLHARTLAENKTNDKREQINVNQLGFGFVDDNLPKLKIFQGLIDKESYEDIFNQLEQVLSKKVLEKLHIHFSIVEYCKGGERRHHTLEQEQEIGPRFQPLAEIIAERKLTPTIICESKDKMASDAIILQKRLLTFIK